MSDIDKETVEKITADILHAAKQSESETDLQTEVEHILRNFFQRIGVNYEPHHNITIINGRPDTLYGRAVIEYKVPSTLKSKTKQLAAIEEVQRNIEEISEKYHDNKEQYVGIVLDGLEVTFTKFRRGNWVTEPVVEVRPETTRRILEYLHGLARKPLHPDYMVADFGPDSPKSIAKECVQILCEELHKTNNARTKVLFTEWKKTFNQVCGYEFNSQKINVEELVQEYDIKTKDLTLPEILFATHTYYAAVIKFLAAEITVAYASPFFKSFLEEIASASQSQLKEKLLRLEDGGMFAELGIKNFLEGDFFGWYLDVWNEQIRSFIQLVIKRLLEYEPATAALEPDEVRDLLKNLYQNLIPIDIRRALGEFFTPDWLADLTLDEVGYEGDFSKRLLDPACGSGTFLVLAIKRCKDYLLDHPEDKSNALNTILRSVVGFDLNPLAVIAARTNYLIALGDLLRFRRNDIQIPVFLSDSISATSMKIYSARRLP